MPRNCLSWISLAKAFSTASNMLLTLPLSKYNCRQKPSLWLLLVLFVGQLFLCQSRCPNLCSGHGSCNSTDSCTCYEGWDGARDCSLRDCKRGVALFSAGGHTTADSMAECSNAGICDRLTLRTCYTGYLSYV